MRFFAVASVLAAVAASANAFIAGFAVGDPASYTASANSSLIVTFRTGSTKVSFLDLSVTFGISSAAKHTATMLGNPLLTVDLVKAGFDSTGPGNFSLEVPLSDEDLFDGSGAYVLTAAIVRLTGNPGEYLFRTDPFTYTFNATVEGSSP